MSPYLYMGRDVEGYDLAGARQIQISNAGVLPSGGRDVMFRCSRCGDAPSGNMDGLGAADQGMIGGMGLCGDLHDFRAVPEILNLTQHPATPEQIADGVVDLEPARRQYLQKLLTFEAVPTKGEIWERAMKIAEFALAGYEVGGFPVASHQRTMIGGAPFLMSALERALQQIGVEPIYAFSLRKSVEETLPSGSVRKTNVFAHAGFVRVEKQEEKRVPAPKQTVQIAPSAFVPRPGWVEVASVEGWLSPLKGERIEEAFYLHPMSHKSGVGEGPRFTPDDFAFARETKDGYEVEGEMLLGVVRHCDSFHGDTTYGVVKTPDGKYLLVVKETTGYLP